ncbi:hypothetical protein [Citrobacter braakii]|uniref:hypothetical protein n=1 Tax=Citrobacter braakii TaxID=57706 RepID=UPI001C7CD338|nr:hypothetical protein [Citrobacter braakii]
MEEFKGTPGPWIASTTDRSVGPVCRDDDQSYGMILPVAWVEFDGKPGHHQANANLIAAAPDLLKALQDFMANASGEAESCGHSFECICRFDKAKAAIAKALGK